MNPFGTPSSSTLPTSDKTTWCFELVTLLSKSTAQPTSGPADPYCTHFFPRTFATLSMLMLTSMAAISPVAAVREKMMASVSRGLSGQAACRWSMVTVSTVTLALSLKFTTTSVPDMSCARTCIAVKQAGPTISKLPPPLLAAFTFALLITSILMVAWTRSSAKDETSSFIKVAPEICTELVCFFRLTFADLVTVILMSASKSTLPVTIFGSIATM
mmetsp:Transcript_136907/g.425354  ORF Transcript_136907/g.425354 Transcript_136907/m.425354 type:complete len:216 (-) Transcript_136907:575-1222(-)